MKNTEAMKYNLNTQLFGEEPETTEDEVVESTIDLDKLDELNKPKEEPTEEEKLREELAKERKRADEAERQRLKEKAALDKVMSERAKLNRQVKEKEKELEAPNEELEQLRAIVAEKELAEKKTALLLAATDRLAIAQTTAAGLVDAVYHPETGELNVDELVDTFTSIISEVRKVEFEKGYETRDIEVASQKPRSYGANKNTGMSKMEEKLEQYRKRNNG